MQAQAHVPTPNVIPSDTSLISCKTIQGTKVFSPAGDDLGHIDDVMIDAASGKIVYGVLQFGGFFGIGSDYFPIPFGRLKYNRSSGDYTTDLTLGDLENAPAPENDWRTNQEWQRNNYAHYGVPYYLP